MVGAPWCTIIVPTLSDDPPTLRSLPSTEELEKLGIELIVSKDMGWKNASKTRNMGAAKASGQVLCFIDDDSSLNYERLLQLLELVRKDRDIFVWHDPPHLLMIKSGLFFKVGGYDERFRPTMAETVELRLKLMSVGLKELTFKPEMVDLRHLKEHPDPRYLLNQKHLTWAYLEYGYIPLVRLVLRKNPIEVLRRVKWVLEWLLWRRYQKRSMFSG